MSLLISAQASMGAITILFAEEATGVRVSFSGSIDLTGAPATGATRGGQVSSDIVAGTSIYIHGSGYFSRFTGVASAQAFPTILSGALITDPGALGFGATSITYDDQHITGGVGGGAVTELTANPAIDNFFLPGESLDSLNAEESDIAEGTVLWTSNGTASDTFIFSRSSAIPEPSSLFLVSLAGLGILRRRR